jgi:hypothetical protein
MSFRYFTNTRRHIIRTATCNSIALYENAFPPKDQSDEENIANKLWHTGALTDMEQKKNDLDVGRTRTYAPEGN